MQKDGDNKLLGGHMNAMFRWILQYRHAKPQTRYFILNWAFYGVLIVASTIYCYARLDYVRSYRTKSPAVENIIQEHRIPKNNP